MIHGIADKVISNSDALELVQSPVRNHVLAIVPVVYDDTILYGMPVGRRVRERVLPAPHIVQ